jgi:hypothetical protein
MTTESGSARMPLLDSHYHPLPPSFNYLAQDGCAYIALVSRQLALSSNQPHAGVNLSAAPARYGTPFPPLSSRIPVGLHGTRPSRLGPALSPRAIGFAPGIPARRPVGQATAPPLPYRARGRGVGMSEGIIE